MPARKPVPSLLRLAVTAIQQVIVNVVRATVFDPEGLVICFRGPTHLASASLRFELRAKEICRIIETVPRYLHQEVLACLNVTPPPRPSSRSPHYYSSKVNGAYFAIAMELLVRVCQSGAAMQKIVTTEECLQKIFEEGITGKHPPKDLTDITLVKTNWHIYFYDCKYVAGRPLGRSLAKVCRELRRLNLAPSKVEQRRWSKNWEDLIEGCPAEESVWSINLMHLIEGCPALEEINLTTDTKPDTYASLLGGLKKLKTIGHCLKWNDIVPLLLKDTQINDIALEKIESCHMMSEQTQQIVFDRCRNVTSVNIRPPYHHLNLCRGLKELILYDEDFRFFLTVFVDNSDTLSHLSLSRINILDVSDLAVLCELPKLEWLELNRCRFSFELRHEDELLHIIQGKITDRDLFPSLRHLTITDLGEYDVWAKAGDLNIFYFLLAAAKGITRLELNTVSYRFVANLLRSALLEKGSLKDLEKFITTHDIDLNMASFDFLLDNCPRLRSLGPLLYWTGLSDKERNACAQRVKEQNLDIHLMPTAHKVGSSHNDCYCWRWS